MSKGSKIVGVRVPPIFLAACEAAIARANRTTKEEPYTMSSWILAAMSRQLQHLSRSEASRKTRKARRAEKIS
jgi:hypothetical protein